MKEQYKFILSVTLLGTIGLFLRYTTLPGEVVALFRSIIGAAFLLAYLGVRKTLPDMRAIRANLSWLILSGSNMGLGSVLLFAAYRKTTVAIASLCSNTSMIIAVLAAPFFLHERLERKKLPFVAAAFTGIVLVSGVIGGEQANLSGMMLGLASALFYAGMILCNRRMSGISAMDRTAFQLITAAVTILPYVLIHDRGVQMIPDLRSVLIVLLLGVVHSGIGFCLYFTGVRNLPIQTVAILSAIEPLVSVLCSVVFLKEPMSLIGWMGTAMIITAVTASESI